MKVNSIGLLAAFIKWLLNPVAGVDSDGDVYINTRFFTMLTYKIHKPGNVIITDSDYK